MAEFWNATVAPNWVGLQERLDAEIKPLGDAALQALAPAAGERVLDIGCGCGQTSLQLAERVGPTGEVVGFDISGPMLTVARARPRASGSGRLSFVQGDAQAADLGAAVFDAAFSRFGWMFFADPVAAFVNIRRALRPGARLGLVTWRALAENPLFTAPAMAAAPFIEPSPSSDPTGPGPFRYADSADARRVLDDAGFSHVAIEPLDTPVGTTDLEGAVVLALKIGPLGAALRETPSLTDTVTPGVREALKRFQTPDGIRIPAAVWIVTARA
jgi:SAM-dependent methyltransferase